MRHREREENESVTIAVSRGCISALLDVSTGIKHRIKALCVLWYWIRKETSGQLTIAPP